MRIVIKIGTHVLIDKKHQLNLALLKNIISQVSLLYKEDYEIIIITSGAVAVGRNELKIDNLEKSASAAIGQAILTKHYHNFLAEHKICSAQVLVSPKCFKDRARYEQLKHTLHQLIELGCISIINENDATVGDDSFGDNDGLAAMVAVVASAKKLVFLTNVNGLYSQNPKLNKSALLIKEVKSVDREIQKMGSKGGSDLGKGGMFAKLRAAKLATTCGINTYIINGTSPQNILNLILKEEKIGTLFVPQSKEVSERKKWLLIGTVSKGKIVVDKGARHALCKKSSLLAVGVRGVQGKFEQGSFVNIADLDNEVFAFGLVNYSSQDLNPLIKMRKKQEIKQKYKKEIVHVDNLTILK